VSCPTPENLEFKDKAGRPIRPGDLVVYSVSYGRSPGLSYGKVLGIVRAKRPSYGKELGDIKLRVHGVDRPWSSVRVNTKPGFLEYSERVLLIGREAVPPDILTQLDALTLDASQNP
jgi:hypothetical protein